MKKMALAIHGGAGTIVRNKMTAELENEYRCGLSSALEAGWKILEGGGTSLDAVERAVCELEDNPLFNAGKGSVFTHDEKNEMDAAIMNGKTLKAGAVAFVKNAKNPIKLARLVMEKTEHILLAGEGANEFAREMKIEMESNEYFHTDFRFQQLIEARRQHKIQLDHTIDELEFIEEAKDAELINDNKHSESLNENAKSKIGTVGAVACDFWGNLAAATSTGGMTNKKFGRVGDTPIIGAGNYADNQTCAVSCTGHGEFFMLTAAAYDVAARMKYKKLTLIEAAIETVEHLREIGGEGGLIAVDTFGNIALPFNSQGMYRGFMATGGEMTIEIYR
jgi:beta-aspartyl-peptidase (threonine type)